MNKTARSIAFVLALTMVFLLVGCAAAAPGEQTATPPTSAEGGQEGQKEYAFERSDFPAFETTDIDGNALDNAVFAEAKVTMVNMWATWCGPCVNELPELQQLSADCAEKGFRIIGVYDYSSTDDEVRTLMDNDGLTYTMARYADAFYPLESGYVPTTYFVDGEGRIMGSAHIGANDYEGWSAVIDELLKDVD